MTNEFSIEPGTILEFPSGYEVTLIRPGPVVWKVDDLGGYDQRYRAFLGSILVTEIDVDIGERPNDWYYYKLMRNGDRHYDSFSAATIEEAIEQVDAYVAAWMVDAGVVKAGAA
jgi:hypothetical protein